MLSEDSLNVFKGKVGYEPPALTPKPSAEGSSSWAKLGSEYFASKGFDVAHQSRVVTLQVEGSSEMFTFGAKSTTKVDEVIDILADFLWCKPEHLALKSVNPRRGPTVQRGFHEVASHVLLSGVKTLKRPTAKYKHPFVVIGAGLGGILNCVGLVERGRHDFVMVERHKDFGGNAWIGVASEDSILQTEKGTYHVDYLLPEASVPHFFEDVTYSTWPSRDMILKMFRRSAEAHGLYEKTIFNVDVKKVRSLVRNGDASKSYTLQYVPGRMDGQQFLDEGDGEILEASAVFAWPGYFCQPNLVQLNGEDAFDGYIEYGSCNKIDYTKVVDNICIVYGHGASATETVRILLEQRCAKVLLLCRKRNVCGTRMVSWMLNQSEHAIPGHIVLDALQKMYDLIGVDVWKLAPVSTNDNHSWATIEQRTDPGVNDMYFLAAYYGLMEVTVDSIKRLGYQLAQTVKGKKLKAPVLIKCLGTVPDFRIDRMLGLKELVGYWIDADPLRPVYCNPQVVQGRSLRSFSATPQIAAMVQVFNWFVDYPEDFRGIVNTLPRSKADDHLPGYILRPENIGPTTIAMIQAHPILATEILKADSLKFRKHREAHPLHEYLRECEEDWKKYTKLFSEAQNAKKKDEPTYPYSEQSMRDLLSKAEK